MYQKNILIVLIVILVAVAGYWLFKNKINTNNSITDFASCAAQGYTIVETYPRQCRTPDGKNFVEQVAVNSPEIIPGVKSILYENPEFGFNFWYPEGSDVRKEGFDGFLRVTSGGAQAAGVFLNSSIFTGTNLGEAAVVVGISADPQAITNCNKVADAEEKSSGTAIINGVVFNSFNAIGVGAGNIYESKIYRMIQRGSCYEIVEMLHSGNIGNYPEGTVVEFDKPKFSGILEKIAKTFVFTSSAGSGVMGTVVTSPTCPVERIPPDPACAPRFYETNITITKAGFSKDIASDFVGRFNVSLDPGVYQFQAKGGATYPRCNPVTVEVKSQSFVWVSISCDTGIR